MSPFNLRKISSFNLDMLVPLCIGHHHHAAWFHSSTSANYVLEKECFSLICSLVNFEHDAEIISITDCQMQSFSANSGKVNNHSTAA